MPAPRLMAMLLMLGSAVATPPPPLVWQARAPDERASMPLGNGRLAVAVWAPADSPGQIALYLSHQVRSPTHVPTYF